MATPAIEFRNVSKTFHHRFSEEWVAALSSASFEAAQGDVRVLITGPRGVERTVAFAVDEAPAAITQRVRETIED
jgi:hypothetical protein